MRVAPQELDQLGGRALSQLSGGLVRDPVPVAAFTYQRQHEPRERDLERHHQVGSNVADRPPTHRLGTAH